MRNTTTNIFGLSVQQLNSLTKYPSIPTYHPMGEKGRLIEDDSQRFDDGDQIVVTEKIDGTNVRIIVDHGDFYIGSRENLLYARGDLIGDPAQGIVDGVHDFADQIAERKQTSSVLVIYGELFGGRVSAASKHYTSDPIKTGFRVFDMIDFGRDELEEFKTWDKEKIAHWRDGGGQCFLHQDTLELMAQMLGLALVPHMNLHHRDRVPTSIEGASQFLSGAISETQCNIGGGTSKPEGVILRSGTRSKIYKMRFEDYERALRQSKKA